MRLSDRSTGRVESPPASDLARGRADDITGAEGVGVRTAANSSAPRLGRRGLLALKQELTERDLGVVRSVADFRLLSGRQIEALHFAAGVEADGAVARRGRRCLQRLTDRRVLHRLERRVGGVRAGSAGFVYSLGAVGQRVLELNGPRPRPHEPSRTFVAHCLAIADVFVAVTLSARAGQLELVTYQTEPRCWRTVPEMGGAGSLRPDLYLVLLRGDVERHWFVEVDLGTEHAPAIRRKCHAYQAYYQSGIEQAKCGVFPRVAWLTPTANRAKRLSAIIAADRRLQPALFLTGTVDAAARVLGGEDAL